MDTPKEIQLSQIDFNEPMLIPPAKPRVRVGINMPQFPGDQVTMTLLGPDQSEFIPINPNFPFYKLMKYLFALNSLESLDLLSRKNLQDAYEDIVSSLPQKIIWKGENLAKFPAARKFMLSQLLYFSSNIKLTANATAVTELALYAFQKINAISSSMKNSIRIDMQTIISDLMCTLPLMYEKVEKNSQMAESWARKALQHLEGLPVVDANDITKRKFFVQMQLAIIYFEMGYTKNAIYWFKKIKQAYHDFYYAESKDMFGLMIRGYQAVIYGLVNDDAFQTLLLGRDFQDLLKIFENGLKSDFLSSKMTHEEYLKIIAEHRENIFEINNVIEQAKKNHAAQFMKVKNESQDFDLINNLQFALPKNNIFLIFSETIIESHIPKSFEKNNIRYQMVGDKAPKLFIVSIYDCSIQHLRKICRYISHLENLEATKKNTVFNHVNPASASVAQITALYSKPVFPAVEPAKKSILKKADTKKDLVEPSVLPEPIIQYHWLSAGMSYCSRDKDSAVKPLSQSSCDIWYGYIAPWILEDRQFNIEFCHKLANAKLSHDCIRDVTKELLTWNNQNFSKEHPYKFKIVISKHDDRLYGWIEDCCKDSKGKMHYLICFGFMGHHKTKFFPDPENIKRKFSKDFSETPKMK